MKQRKLILICGMLVLLLAAASLLYNRLGSSIAPDNLGQQEENNDSEPDKVLAPDFTVLDADGNTVKFSDFRGKPVVINFWATWCGYCINEMPAFEKLYREMGDEIHFLIIDVTDGVQETLAKASSFIADSGYTFPVYYDTLGSAATIYGATYSLPRTYFFDAEGYGIAQAIGAINEELLLQGIAMIQP